MDKRHLTSLRIKKFQEAVWIHYRAHKRDLPWRRTASPYRILVSEVMLQQTQVERVKKYYAKFLKEFPDWSALARAPLRKILALWQGMGYNRRAIYLKQIAERVVHNHKGVLPKDIETLIAFPGIGKSTASAILAYAYNIPTPFIETNIRRIFIHHFFKNQQSVHDSHILPLIEAALDRENPREWHWALMDYGTFLAQTQDNPNKRSAHYVRQPAFKGSRRELRGMILKLLLDFPHTLSQIACKTKKKISEVETVFDQLMKERLIRKHGKKFYIS